jgi:hypothetical protein
MEVPVIEVMHFLGDYGMRALTPDLTGKNLPPVFGPWRPFKITTLNGSDQAEMDAMAAINDHGYFLIEKNTNA